MNPLLTGQQASQFRMRVGEIFGIAAASSQIAFVCKVVNGCKRSHRNLCCFHPSLHWFPVWVSAAAKPDGDASGQHPFCALEEERMTEEGALSLLRTESVKADKPIYQGEMCVYSDQSTVSVICTLQIICAANPLLLSTSSALLPTTSVVWRSWSLLKSNIIALTIRISCIYVLGLHPLDLFL